ncbi:MAG: serine hydrolase domain-containing protein [Acutalibacteraceae bacterium]
MVKSKTIERAKSAESVGIDSSVITKMTEEMSYRGINVHSLMILRDGKVACEAWSSPLTAEIPHMVYSVSKSFLATAYGFALDEGKVKKDTRLLDVFPELRGKKRDENLEKLTIHHLLCMTAGKQTSIRGSKSDDWMDSFIRAKWIFEPGTSWRYVNDNYYVASKMLCKILGMSITEYLTPRLYEPLGIDVPFWEHSPDGVETGGWGLMLKTEDMAKFILCYQNKGVFDGCQVIPKRWTEEATGFISDNSVSEKAADASAGYGCGFWRCGGMPNTYRCEGMFCQYGISFEDYNACLVMTSEHSDLQETLDVIWKYMPHAFIEPDSEKHGQKILLPDKSDVTVKERQNIEKTINGKKYKLKRCKFINSIGFPISVLPMPIVFFAKDRGGNITDLSFDFDNDDCTFRWKEDGDFENELRLSMNGGANLGVVKLGELQMTVRCYAYWEKENLLVVRIRPLAAVAERILKFEFKGKKIKMYPSYVPGTDEKAQKVGEKLKCILIGRWFHWWIDFLVPRVGKILNPTHRGKEK